ncbi:SRPBCC family protein [Paenibacillus sinopodophylli]|uniref:SRPBCC family protein n=1 Tax=Paenibacillus sinopodophylli TaxID=1837342 RepID=UPI00110D1ECC|nr:SRPBCC family protein [Paenibacillus sinopodophylli]
MVEVVTEIYIDAPIEICFDLARDIDIHTKTVWKHTREKAVEGVTSGLIQKGELVTFEATHFGVRQRLTSKITEMDIPFFFVDETQKGAFKALRHEHHFEKRDSGTLMTDVLRFEAPLGMLGWITERLILKRYMRKFLDHRNKQLKLWAEQPEG